MLSEELVRNRLRKVEERMSQVKRWQPKYVELYYKEDIVITKNKYEVGDNVFLKKGTFIHGLGGSPDSYNNFKIFDYVCENGFIGGDFNDRPTVKILNSVGMWNIKKICI